MADDDNDGGGLGPDELDELGELGDEDDADTDDRDDDDADDGDEGKPWKPPSKSEWERAQRRLKRYADEKAGRKGAGSVDEKLRKQLGGKGKDDAGDDDTSAGQEEAARWRLTAARQSAATALSAAGFSGTAKQAARLTRLLDLEDSEPDKDGVFDFEDDVEDLKEEYPELFGGKGARRNERAGRGRPGRTAPTRRDATEDATSRTTKELLRQAGFR
jgi:hypothetical protein